MRLLKFRSRDKEQSVSEGFSFSSHVIAVGSHLQSHIPSVPWTIMLLLATAQPMCVLGAVRFCVCLVSQLVPFLAARDVTHRRECRSDRKPGNAERVNQIFQ